MKTPLLYPYSKNSMYNERKKNGIMIELLRSWCIIIIVFKEKFLHFRVHYTEVINLI